MTDIGKHICIVLIPLILSNSLHMLLVKRKGLAVLQIPVWEKGFGANKTWRGFFFVPLINGIILFVLATMLTNPPDSPFVLGFLLGLSYMLAELPNSFLKRTLGIQSGAHPDRNKAFFFLLDKTDSALGVTLAYYFLSAISINTALILFLINSITHIVFSYLLVNLKIKSSF